MILASSVLLVCWEFVTRHPGLLLVLLGVAGEVFFDWKEMTGKRSWVKKSSAILLILGLMVEFWEAATSDHEAAVLMAKVEELRKSNLELEAKLQHRQITLEQRGKFIAFLKNAPKAPIVVLHGSGEGEVISYSNQIREMLDAAGYGGADSTGHIAGVEFNSHVSIRGQPTNQQSLVVLMIKTNKMPAFGSEMAHAFDGIGISNAVMSTTENIVSPSGLTVFVGSKYE